MPELKNIQNKNIAKHNGFNKKWFSKENKSLLNKYIFILKQ